VVLTGRFSDETGRHHHVVLADSAELRARVNSVTVSVSGEQPPPLPVPGPGYVQLAQSHPDVAEVLDILGKGARAPDWSDLYEIHEIMLNNVPGFYQRGWVTEDQISTFTASANRKEVSGDLARHARLKGDPPKRTMTLVEARQLIGSLVLRGWIGSVHPQAPDLSTQYGARRPPRRPKSLRANRAADDRRGTT
jgi:hypothetical protein